MPELHVLSSSEFAKEIRLFNLSEYFSRFYKRIGEKLVLAQSEVSFTRIFKEGLSGIISTIGMVFSWILIALQIIRTGLSIGLFHMHTQAALRMSSSVNTLSMQVAFFYEQLLQLSNLLDLLDKEPNLLNYRILQPKKKKRLNKKVPV